MGSAAALELNPETVKPPKGRVASGMNSEGRGCRRSLRSKSDLNDGVKMDVEGVTSTDMKKKKRIASETTEGSAGSRKMPKRVAACLDFKEKSIRLNEKSSIYETKDGLVVEEELEAIRLTEGIHGKDEIRPNRRLVDFILHDFDGVPKPFEMSEVEDLYITAVILPLELSEKEKEKGVRCEGFGRIEEWSISGYEDGSPIIWVSTDLADYDCVKPGSSYRESFGYFYDKAKICVEVFQKLSPTCGGNPNSSLEELLATVVRSMSATKTFHGVPSKDFIVSLGEFIYTQLVGLDDTSTAKDQIFAKLPVLVSLLDECKKRNDLSQLEAVVLHGTLQIKDGDDPGKSVSSSDIIDETEDEKLARLLQDEEFRKSMKKQNRRNISGSHKKFYIKINEDEIANDYPLPAYYKSSAEEIDEYIFFDDDSHCLYPDELPRRMLHNWSLYNSESRLISLELLPVCPGAQVDVTIFGSGNMTEDNGSGFCIEGDSVQSSSSGGLEEIDSDGIPIYLSAVKEWMIEFGSSTVFVSIRTDTAWYRLGRPSKQYSPWYEPVLKTAKLAIGIIKLLKEQSRASKLSFPDVIKKVSEFERDDPAYISSNPSAVERYVVVHGQIILRQFSVYPDDAIRKCAFVSVLSDKMEERHHTKLVMNKKMLVKKEINLNPRATLAPVQSKRKAMRATTTKLINRIWRDYYSSHFQEEPKVGDGLELKEEEEIEEEENEEEENGELDNVLIQGSSSPKPPNLNSKTCKLNSSTKEIRWEGESIGKMSTCEALYRSAVVRGIIISLGSTVLVETDSDSEGDTIIYVEYLFEKLDQRKMAHGRVMQRGCSTVLGNASNDSEVFLINECLEIELSEVKQEVAVEMRSISWGHQHRKENINTYNITKAKEEERKKRDLAIEYYCKSLYWPERGAFFDLPLEKMGLGSGICDSCKLGEAQKDDFGVNSSKARFVHRKVEYSVQDFVYVVPSHCYEETEEVAKYKAGRNIGLKAYVVCQLLEIEVTPQGSKQANHESTKVKVRRFFRPEDISAEKAYMSDIREVYYSEEILKLSVEVLEGKCDVRRKHEVPSLDDATAFDHIFFCEYSYDFSNGSLKQLPANMKLRNLVGKVTHGVSSRKSKGKSKVGEDDWDNVNQVEGGLCLATLDIFAGCGGLSEGLQNSGVSVTKWAIEYDEPAADAFKLNHPDALVFNDNCNVILRAIMEKCGDKDDCISTSEAAEQAARLSQEKINNLPAPGEVDFINGGPPCQGFSGMNRFSQSTWSKVQCEMILAFLSFAEYFRPKFFLLENVRNFVSFNKGQTFRLTLASLLEMGYQVRFGILEAGAFGVSQSRKRAFIWAAAPGQILPEWPEPMHVFGSPELKIALPGGVHYTAVRSTAGGAPFRSITVRDTIGDLPKVKNGASHPDIQYTMDPVSWFQKQIRGSMMTLCDHISKEMNELNYIRCQRIPKRPGADWRDLPDEKVKLSTGQMVDLIPWCLPNTAKRHNQWKGLFGRLDWEGNFPTSITDPQPMGKVGMCFHPEQDRILTVRECARSQGFPDSYYFSGNIQNKHRQIGNAVPPPLAFALGRKLKKAVEAKAANSLN